MLIDYSKLDRGCVDLVKYFNSHGLKTASSCEGHGKQYQRLFYITFRDFIDDLDIIEFQSQRLDERGNFCSNGHFAKRIFVYSEPVVGGGTTEVRHRVWEYVADSIESANADLERWMQKDLSKSFEEHLKEMNLMGI